MFVPGAPFDNWRVSGHGRGGRKGEARVHSVHVGAGIETTSVRVETSLAGSRRRADDSLVASNLLGNSVPAGAVFPFTATVTRQPAAIALDGNWIAVNVLACGSAWHVSLQIDDRWVDVEGRDVDLGEVELSRVDDLADLPDWRL